MAPATFDVPIAGESVGGADGGLRPPTAYGDRLGSYINRGGCHKVSASVNGVLTVVNILTDAVALRQSLPVGIN